jgi:outer membrane receptor protein involved in Fe transport
MYKSLPFALAALSLSINAIAQSAMEEVVVTATFDESSLLSTPSSVSVIDSKQIEARSAGHLEQILLAAPNITAATGASRSRFIQIRGIGDLEQFTEPKYQASVGLTIDDIDLSGLAGGATLFDAQQVEILRGPQGTRFGNSGLAGMINVISAAPTEKFEGEVSAGAGKYDSYNTGLMLSGALSDSVRGRIAMQQQKSDGYIENDTLNRDDTNNIDEQTVRAKLQWQISDTSQLDWTVLHLDKDNGYDAYSYDNSLHTRSDEPGYDKQDTLATSVKLSQTLSNNYLLETIVALTDSDLDYGFDEDWEEGLNAFWSANDNYLRDQQTGSFEVRLHSNRQVIEQGDSDWTVGIYYKQRDEELKREYRGTDGFVSLDFDFASDYDDQSQAVFGQYQYALSNRLHLTGGLRFEQFEYDYKDDANTPFSSGDNLWGGELTLEYLATEDTLFYTTVSRGYKAGGVNANARAELANGSLVTPTKDAFVRERQTFDEETLINFEIGLKGSYLEDRLNVQAALFRMERDNPQLESWVAEGFTWVSMLDGASEGTNQGIEIESRFQVNDALSLTANVGYMDTDVEDLIIYDMDSDALINVSGRDQAKAPHYQYSVGANLQLSDQLRGNLIVEGSDGYYTGFHHEGQIDSYQLVHASLTYNVADVEIQAWARNLLDEDYDTHGLYIFGHYTQQGEPRTYGINARYQF